MNKPKEELQNPYRPPTSTLRGGARPSGDWSPEAISNAEKYMRCLLLGVGFALSTVLLAWIVLDVFLFGWEEISLPILPTQWLILTSILVAFVGNFQFSKTYVKYQSQRKTVQQFLTRNQRELGKWYNKPLVNTVVVASVAVLFLLCFHWLSIWLDFFSTITTIRLRALLAIPPVMPIVYLVLRHTMQKAGKYLQMLKQ